MTKRPFLARDGIVWLAVFSPAITLLISNMDAEHAAFERILRCLLSTWVCTVAGGASVHLLVNWVAPRLLARTTRPVAYAAVAGVAAGAVTLVMLALMPRLAWLDENLAGSPAIFVLQAILVAELYVVGMRLVTWMRQRHEELEERGLRAQLAALQARLNPHFLFNTLNAIASLIPKEPSVAESTVERLASVLQYSITSTMRERVKLDEELSAVRDYLAIEHARFGDRLRSRIDVEGSLGESPVPPMLLQPLVENAVLHGLSGKEEGGTVTVEGRAVDGAMVLTVKDDGVGPGRSTRRGNHVGLENLRERLALTYGARARLSVGARAGGGFECEIRVPRAPS